MLKCIKYYLEPKYVIMKGVQIQNRAIMFIGASPVFHNDGYEVKFSNHSESYWKSNIAYRIWTFKQLISWRRELGTSKDSRCLEKRFGKWKKIKDKETK